MVSHTHKTCNKRISRRSRAYAHQGNRDPAPSVHTSRIPVAWPAIVDATLSCRFVDPCQSVANPLSGPLDSPSFGVRYPLRMRSYSCLRLRSFLIVRLSFLLNPVTLLRSFPAPSTPVSNEIAVATPSPLRVTGVGVARPE